ncbi:MAG: biotin--[acetyl-CoA-carboxylase] ligase [Phycisphaerales bacterium]|nr:MAG: biotin--[acetyl-CoA-carboxylase] ligase [Phycisphaerales bacterium]
MPAPRDTATTIDRLLAAARRVEEVDSTSLWARRAIEAGEASENGALFVAATQTGGRGRLGRAWASPEGGLWTTLAHPIPPERHDALVDGLGLRVGAACLTTIRETLAAAGADPNRVRLKWPNDVLIDGRKTLGALTEVVRAGGRAWALIGVGVNANNALDDLPDDVRAHATTLRDALRAPVDLERLLRTLVTHLLTALARDGADALSLRAARASLHGVGTTYTVTLPDGARVEGVLEGLNRDGLPLLRTREGAYVPPRIAELGAMEA